MSDLFGDSVTSPKCAESSMPKFLINAAFGFNEFWKAWPAHPRKVGKQQCLDRWARLGCAENASHIAAYVEWLKTQDDWLRGFLPMPATFLSRQGWIDWEPPIVRKKTDAFTEVKAHKGTPMPDYIRDHIKRIKGQA